MCTDSPIQSHFTGDTGALPLTVSSRLTTVLLCALIALYRAISLGRDEGRMVTVQTPIKAPSLCGGCSPRLLLAILQHLFLNFVAGSPLSVDRAVAVLGRVAGRWREVGYRLWVPDAVRDLIASECTSDSECLRKALRYWIQRDPLASWRQLIWRVTDDVRSLAEELTGQCYSVIVQCLSVDRWCKWKFY